MLRVPRDREPHRNPISAPTSPAGRGHRSLDAPAAGKLPSQRDGLLLDFDLRARFFELLLDGRGLVLAHAFLHGLWRTIDEILGFLESEAGDFANGLNH